MSTPVIFVERELQDLRVIDLKAELEKRNLDKTGNKATLVERLGKALETEGHDPVTYKFQVGDNGGNTSMKQKADDENADKMDDGDVIEFMEQDDDQGINGDEDAVENALIPNPSDVEPSMTFTAEDTIKLHAAAHPRPPGDESASMIVNTDDKEQNELDVTTDGGGSQASLTPPVSENEMGAGIEPITSGGDTSPEKSSTGPEAGIHQQGKSSTDSKPNEQKACGRGLWISGLAANTRATDLKALFSKYGRVSAAKIVTSAKQPGSKCFGFVSMSTPEEAAQCIQHLHRSDLHGRMISVERSTNDSVIPFMKKADQKSVSASPLKPASSEAPLAKTVEPLKTEKKADEKKDEDKAKTSEKRDDRHKSKSKSRSNRDDQKDRDRRKEDDDRRDRRFPVRRPSFRSYRGRGTFRGATRPMRGSSRASFMQPRGIGYNSTRGRFGGDRYSSGADRYSSGGDRYSSGGDRYSSSGAIRERDLEAMARQQEILRMEMERERLRLEREQITKERLQLEQMRQIQMAAPIAAPPYQQSNRYAVPFESPRKRAFDEPLQYAPKHRREEDRRIGSSGGSTGGGRGREVRREERFERGRDRPKSPPRNYATRREDRSPRGSRGRYGSPPRNGRDRRAPPASTGRADTGYVVSRSSFTGTPSGYGTISGGDGGANANPWMSGHQVSSSAATAGAIWAQAPASGMPASSNSTSSTRGYVTDHRGYEHRSTAGGASGFGMGSYGGNSYGR